ASVVFRGGLPCRNVLAAIMWPEQLLNPSKQVFGVKGFGEEFEVIAAAPGVFQYLRGLSLAGEQQDVAATKLLANGDGQLDAVHARDYHVTENQIGSLFSADLKGRSAVVSCFCLVAFGIKDQCEGVSNAFFIVDNHDKRLRRIRGRT